MSDDLVLYDIASKLGVGWNGNCWKARMLLNFKGVPYKTEWLEYPDIAPTLKAAGVPAHPPDFYATHTLPTIRLDGAYTMDSRAIADVIEARYPSPPLHLESEVLAPVLEHVAALVPALKSFFMASVPRDVLLPRSAEYWHRTRSGFLGQSVEELERTADRDAEWEAARPHLDRITALLKQHADGPFFLGKTPSYSDIVLAAYLKGTSVYSKETFRVIMDSDKAFSDLFEAARPWMQRNDH